ncbi:hypothetical protein GJ744_009653 [Endocarpon pusillum]|uniref:Chromo domain-containing protein n=1 Tax=Endocarpon pusillum TaxID=364733 RepID=A0A8H7AJA8_9EURO|nr:hypothetical protein GJ744_009653 [Endocarpon pusillum]
MQEDSPPPAEASTPHDKHLRKGRVEYLVEWVPTWEQGDSLSNLDKAVGEYEDMQRLFDDGGKGFGGEYQQERKKRTLARAKLDSGNETGIIDEVDYEDHDDDYKSDSLYVTSEDGSCGDVEEGTDDDTMVAGGCRGGDSHYSTRYQRERRQHMNMISSRRNSA